jgi:hypothetical protein
MMTLEKVYETGMVTLPSRLDAAGVAIAGDDPMPCNHFHTNLSWLSDYGCDFIDFDGLGDESVVVVGKDLSADEHDLLLDHIRARAGKELFVYSQQMFLVYWFSVNRTLVALR